MRTCITTLAGAVLAWQLVTHPAAAVTVETSVVVGLDTAAADDFGTDVAMEGTTLVVGAPFADIGGNSAQGAVYIFELIGGVWTQVQKLTASDGSAADLLGYSVAISGDRIVAGAEEANIGANNAQGAAYIFERVGGVWVEVHKLSEPTTIQNVAEYGSSVAIQGDWIVVGAAAAGSAQHGQAFIYQRDEGGPGAWGLVAALEDDIFDTNAGFGASVAIDGDLVVVGARMLDRVPGTYLNEGGAYVFHRDVDGYWNQVGKLFRTGAQDNEFGGCEVAIEGSTIVMGAKFTDGPGLARGAVCVFENPTLADDGWTQVAELTASDGADSDFFGNAVALRDGRTWVGALEYGAANGRAYRFDADLGGPGVWGQAEVYASSTPASNDWLGQCFAVTSTHVAVGAFGWGVGGAVLVYPAPAGSSSAVGDDRTPAAFSPVTAQPNPFNPATTLAFATERAGEVEVMVHDLRGALVDRVFRGSLPAGEHALTWRADGLASGVYLATVRVGNAVRTTAVTLAK